MGASAGLSAAPPPSPIRAMTAPTATVSPSFTRVSDSVPATGEVRYQYFVVDPGFTEDKWVKSAECRPGNRAVVHHIIVGLAAPGSQGRIRELGGQHSEWLTATAPGARPLMLRDGMAKLIPAGSKLVFQMHYTPNGTATEDRSCVGFIFADGELSRILEEMF